MYMDIAKILKDCTVGTKLYSPLFGDVTLVNVDIKSVYAIDVKTVCNEIKAYTRDGRYFEDYLDVSECLLFPSKEQRDWSKFVIPRKDLEKGTPCVCFDDCKDITDLMLRTYYGNSGCYNKDQYNPIRWKYIIPVDKFNFKDFTFNNEDNYGLDYKK